MTITPSFEEDGSAGPAQGRFGSRPARVTALATAVFEHAPIGIALVRSGVHDHGHITLVNPEFRAITGYDEVELIGRLLADLHHPEDLEGGLESLGRLSSGATAFSGERRYLRRDGRIVWVQVRIADLHQADDPHVLVQIQDITERRGYEQELRYLADHDPLTGLFNQRRFREELEWVASYCRRYSSPAAVIALDVDNFKYVNDTFGHATGDEVLCAVAETLRTRCRGTDVIGRLGGDEFGIILPQCGAAEAQAAADSLLAAVRDGARVTAGGRGLGTTISLGLRLVAPGHVQSAEEILSEADMALYDAKESGRNRLSIAGDDSPLANRHRLRRGWSERVREALLEDRFLLFEQPILRIESGRIESSELLIRMQGPEGELIPPGAFMEIAERSGQVQAIDCWVIARGIRLLAERQAAGIDLSLEVNLSGGSITDPSVIDFIAGEVRNAPIDPTRLTFEITETAAIVNIGRARELASRLSDLGCRFALDDFGSGFGSLYHLKHLPFDAIKIDGDFVKDLPSCPVDRLTVEAIVQIARGMGRPTIAEFVEDAETLDLLRTLGVDYAQGYYIGRPQPVVTAPSFIDARS